MQAAAYTMGDHVVFAGRPDLHTVAHEAAHVVQQRRGIQLTAGIGQRGDHYEQHADAIADRVRVGQSAEDLLDWPTAGKTSSSPVIQRTDPPKQAQKGMEKALEEEKKKKKRPKPMSLQEFSAKTPSLASSKIYSNKPAATTQAPTKQQQAALAPAKEEGSKEFPRIQAAIKKWKPSKGHDGIKALDATEDDLKQIVAIAQEDGRYRVVKGAGTGAYSEKSTEDYPYTGK